MTTLYKTTGPAGEPIHGGSGAWPLPVDGQPGAVRAYGSATVTGTDAVTIVSWWGNPGVRIDKRAVWIERGGNSTQAPKVHVVAEPTP